MFSEKTYRSTGRIVTRRIGEDQLLVPVSGGVAGENVVFPLNSTGLLIWEQLTEGKTVQETAVAMVAQFEVELAQGLTDCKEMVQALLDQHLLEEKGR